MQTDIGEGLGRTEVDGQRESHREESNVRSTTKDNT